MRDQAKRIHLAFGDPRQGRVDTFVGDACAKIESKFLKAISLNRQQIRRAVKTSLDDRAPVRHNRQVIIVEAHVTNRIDEHFNRSVRDRLDLFYSRALHPQSLTPTSIPKSI